jgi:hypothetical protein
MNRTISMITLEAASCHIPINLLHLVPAQWTIEIGCKGEKKLVLSASWCYLLKYKCIIHLKFLSELG